MHRKTCLSKKKIIEKKTEKINFIKILYGAHWGKFTEKVHIIFFLYNEIKAKIQRNKFFYRPRIKFKIN